MDLRRNSMWASQISYSAEFLNASSGIESRVCHLHVLLDIFPASRWLCDDPASLYGCLEAFLALASRFVGS